MKKLTARWVPRVLTDDQEQERVATSKKSLAMLKHDKADFFRWFITVDETWIHHYTTHQSPNNKLHNRWEPVKIDQKDQKHNRALERLWPVLAAVFWDSKGTLLVDYLEKGKTITGVLYSSLLDQMNDAIRQKRPHLAKKKVLFLQDNAPANKSAKVMAKLLELRYEVLPHPPDLDPSDYFMFPNVKRWLQGKRFASNERSLVKLWHFLKGLENSVTKQV